MSTLTITEFLEARIAEDEFDANRELLWGTTPTLTRMNARVLAECAAKRAIIAMHRGESWSVPHPPHGDHNTYVTESDRPGEVRVKLGGSFVETISQEEYFKRMGATKNPPAIELRALAAVYADHADYNADWAL